MNILVFFFSMLVRSLSSYNISYKINLALLCSETEKKCMNVCILQIKMSGFASQEFDDYVNHHLLQAASSSSEIEDTGVH